MMPNHSRLQELFLAACDLPEAQQIALMDEQCANDPELRHELQLLLRTEERRRDLCR